MEQDNTQFRLGCLNLTQNKYVPDETVEHAKLVCKFTEEVKVSDHLLKPCMVFSPLAKEALFYNNSLF